MDLPPARRAPLRRSGRVEARTHALPRGGVAASETIPGGTPIIAPRRWRVNPPIRSACTEQPPRFAQIMMIPSAAPVIPYPADAGGTGGRPGGWVRASGNAERIATRSRRRQARALRNVAAPALTAALASVTHVTLHPLPPPVRFIGRAEKDSGFDDGGIGRYSSQW